MELAQQTNAGTGGRYAGDLLAGWPESIPYITREEAEAAEKRLYRKFARRDNGQRKKKYTWGFRRSWVQLSGETDNLNKGWRGLVHDISHDVHRFLYPSKTPHGSFHSTLEREMIDYVVMQTNWLQGGLKKRVKVITVQDRRERKLAKAKEAVAVWTRKLKLAQTKLTKYKAEEKRLEKVVAVPHVEQPRKPRTPSLTPRKPRKLSERRAKIESLDLCEEFGIDLDYIRETTTKYPRFVYPPCDLYADETDDPHYGDHTVDESWIEVHGMVCEYVEAILAKGQDPIDADAQ